MQTQTMTFIYAIYEVAGKYANCWKHLRNILRKTLENVMKNFKKLR